MKGKKTYITAILMGLLSVAYGLDFMDKSTYDVLMGVLISGGLAFLRLGVSKTT